MPTIAAMAVALAAAGCGNGDDVCTTTSALTSDGGTPDGAALDGGGDATTGGGAKGDASADGAANADGSPELVAEVRFANWSAGAPAVDFCLAPHGTTAFQGPLLAALAGGSDAGAGAVGLAFPETSGYLSIAPQRYDARLVTAGSINCSAPVTEDETNLPEWTSGTLATVALLGDLSAPDGGPGNLTLAGFLDELSTTAVAVRFINAVAGSAPVNFGFQEPSSPQFYQIYTEVAFAQAGTVTGGFDAAATPAETYLSDNIGSQTVSFAVQSGSNDSVFEVTAPDLTLAAGSVTTFVFVGPVSIPDAGAPVDELLMCVDNAGTVGLLGACSVIAN
jgi:hypothetical protein